MKHLTIQTPVLNLSEAANKSYFDKLNSLRLCLVGWLLVAIQQIIMHTKDFILCCQLAEKHH